VYSGAGGGGLRKRFAAEIVVRKGGFDLIIVIERGEQNAARGVVGGSGGALDAGILGGLYQDGVKGVAVEGGFCKNTVGVGFGKLIAVLVVGARDRYKIARQRRGIWALRGIPVILILQVRCGERIVVAVLYGGGNNVRPVGRDGRDGGIEGWGGARAPIRA